MMVNGVKRLVTSGVVGVLVSAVFLLGSANVASARVTTVVKTVSSSGSACTAHNPCGPKKSHFPTNFVPPANLVATTTETSITLSWTPVQEIFVVSALPSTYTCTLLYGYSTPSTFTVTTPGNSCEFDGLSPNTEYGVSVAYGTFPNQSAPASAFAATLPIPVLTGPNAGGGPSSGSKTPKTPVIPEVSSVKGTAVVGSTKLISFVGSKFYGHVTVWVNDSSIAAVVKSVSAKKVVVAVTPSANTKPGTYSLTVVDPNQSSTSATFKVR